MRLADSVGRERVARLRADGWMRLPMLETHSIISRIGLSHPRQFLGPLTVLFEVGQ